MSCFICGRSACCQSFHSLEEQEAFEPAEEAYERFLEMREKCREAWRGTDSTGLSSTEDG